ncbi:alpha-l-rhamnosidase [Colletotrichum asianum]
MYAATIIHVLALAAAVTAAQVSIASVTVNDLVTPLGVDNAAPIFGWSIGSLATRGASFAAAQVQVLPATGTSPLWDSGTVATNATSLVYSGQTLPSRASFNFQVRLLDNSGDWTEWSSSNFGTGLLANEDWESARWIGAANPSVDQPILRTDFDVSQEIASAKLFITAIGGYEAYLNGQRVGDLYLAPSWTQYAKRSFYDTHDVTKQIIEGQNAIGIALFITFKDNTTQTIVTDSSWRGKLGGSTRTGAIPNNELFDSRIESQAWKKAGFNASAWPNAIVQTPPSTEIQSSPVEPVRIKDKIKAVSITNPESGVWVYDFGRNIAGVGALTVNEAYNTSIRMHYGEKLRSTGRIQDTGGNWQHSTYIHDGTGSVTWIPRHSYYGFRYIELTGVAGTPNAGTVVAQRLHSDVRGIGWFTASDDTLTWIHDTTWQTMLNNIVGVPTDGAYLEKLPWLSDAAVMSETILSSLNVKSLYTKWAQDIADSALADGNLPPWAPSPLEMDPFPSPTWGNAFPEVVWQLYQHSGDVDLLSRFYDSIKSYLAYELNHRNSSGLIGLESWGDWVTPSINDKGIVGTAHLYCSITRVIQMASILGYSADIESYTSHAAAVNSSFHDAYYQAATGDYRSSSTGGFAQTNNLLPAAFKMTSPTRRQAVIDKVAADVVSRDNHLGTGVAGTKWLLPLLTEYGYIDLAYSVATQTTYPSWGYWKSLGATSLWEEWAGSSRSQNHPFLGTVVDWFYQHLADDDAFIHFGQSTVDSFTADSRFICKSLDAVLNQFEPTINQLQVPSSQAWDRSRMINYLKSILKKGPNVVYFALINVSAKKYQENWVSTSSKDTIEMLVEALRLEHWISTNYTGTLDVLVEPDVSLITHLGTKLHALHQACDGRDVDTSRFILNETTTSIDIRDAFDNTPLHHVAMCKRSEEDTDDPLTTDPRSIIQLLLGHGADINARNIAGHTPLQECFTPPGYPNIDVAVVLLQE